MNKELQNNGYISLELKDGVIYSNYSDPRLKIDLEAAKKIVEFRLDYFEGKSFPVIINTPGLMSMDKSARDYFSSDLGVKGIKACAVVTPSIFLRTLVNFFTAVNVINLKFPQKVFSNVDDAKVWLSQYQIDN